MADVNDVETVCGTLADPLNVLPVVSCPNTGVKKVTIRSLQASTRLTLSSVGIMHNCDCATTSLDSSLFPGQVTANPADSYLNVAVTETQTTDLYIYDTISLVCGDATGLTFCGTGRTATIYKSGVLDTSGLVTYSSGSLFVTAPDLTHVGTHIFEIRTSLDSVPGSEVVVTTSF